MHGSLFCVLLSSPLVLMLLLTSYADAARQSKPHHVNMFRAAQRGNIKKLKEEINRRPEMVNLVGSRGFTPLHWAALRGRTEAVHVLLSAGADITVLNKRGSTSLLLAAWKGHYDICLSLIAAMGTHQLEHINSANDGGQTALNWSIRGGYAKITALLIHAGADKTVETAALDAVGWATALKRKELFPLLSGEEMPSREITEALANAKRSRNTVFAPKKDVRGEEL